MANRISINRDALAHKAHALREALWALANEWFASQTRDELEAVQDLLNRNIDDNNATSFLSRLALTAVLELEYRAGVAAMQAGDDDAN